MDGSQKSISCLPSLPTHCNCLWPKFLLSSLHLLWKCYFFCVCLLTLVRIIFFYAEAVLQNENAEKGREKWWGNRKKKKDGMQRAAHIVFYKMYPTQKKKLNFFFHFCARLWIFSLFFASAINFQTARKRAFRFLLKFFCAMSSHDASHSIFLRTLITDWNFPRLLYTSCAWIYLLFQLHRTCIKHYCFWVAWMGLLTVKNYGNF